MNEQHFVLSKPFYFLCICETREKSHYFVVNLLAGWVFLSDNVSVMCVLALDEIVVHNKYTESLDAFGHLCLHSR